MSTRDPQLPSPQERRFRRRRPWLPALTVFASWALGVGSSGAQPPAAVLDNAHVVVARNNARCAMVSPACERRVIVALGDVAIAPKTLKRGDVAVFGPHDTYPYPTGEFLEVTIRPDRPPIKAPSVVIPPDKNAILYEDDDFLVFEEKLDPGDTRARHSHRERVVVVINRTRLQQWPDEAPEVFRDQIPDDVRFNPPVVHVVKTVGELPLRNIVIEFKR